MSCFRSSFFTVHHTFYIRKAFFIGRHDNVLVGEHGVLNVQQTHEVLDKLRVHYGKGPDHRGGEEIIYPHALKLRLLVYADAVFHIGKIKAAVIAVKLRKLRLEADKLHILKAAKLN